MRKARSEKRQRQDVIRVRVSESEDKAISGRAAACSMTEPEFLRHLGLGYEPRSRLDQQAIIQLAKVSAEQARLGGLLKFAVTELRKEDRSADAIKVIDILIGDLQNEQLVLRSILLQLRP